MNSRSELPADGADPSIDLKRETMCTIFSSIASLFEWGPLSISLAPSDTTTCLTFWTPFVDLNASTRPPSSSLQIAWSVASRQAANMGCLGKCFCTRWKCESPKRIIVAWRFLKRDFRAFMCSSLTLFVSFRQFAWVLVGRLNRLHCICTHTSCVHMITIHADSQAVTQKTMKPMECSLL